MKLYLIGSLRNPKVPEIAVQFRGYGFDVFDDWYAAGPEADDHWKAYEKGRGHDYIQALAGEAAKHVFSFDYRHLNGSDASVLVLPAGKSGHLELGYLLGQGKPGVILLDAESDRWDVMYPLASLVTYSVDEAAAFLARRQ